MSSSLTNGYTRKCKSGQGGLNKVYLFSYTKYSRSQIVLNQNIVTYFPETIIYEFETVGNATFTNRGSEDDGGKYYNEELSFQLAIVDVDNQIRKFLNKDLRAIVLDNNGKYRLLGVYNGLECNSVKASIGTSKNTFNGYTVTLEGKELNQSFYINKLEDAGFTIYEIAYLLQENEFNVLQEDESNIVL